MNEPPPPSSLCVPLLTQPSQMPPLKKKKKAARCFWQRTKVFGEQRARFTRTLTGSTGRLTMKVRLGALNLPIKHDMQKGL